MILNNNLVHHAAKGTSRAFYKRVRLTMGFDRIAEALRDQTRRQLLVELLDHNPVARPTSEAENETRENEEREIQLIHNHLPRLDAMGYIVWDRSQENIIKGPNWNEIEPVVRLLSDNRERLPNNTFSRSRK